MLHDVTLLLFAFAGGLTVSGARGFLLPGLWDHRCRRKSAGVLSGDSLCGRQYLDGKCDPFFAQKADKPRQLRAGCSLQLLLVVHDWHAFAQRVWSRLARGTRNRIGCSSYDWGL